MDKMKYENIFFNSNIPIANYEALKSFITDKYGFNISCVKVLRSYDEHVCYPLFKNEKCCYIIFEVKGLAYSCINGELQLLGERGRNIGK